MTTSTDPVAPSISDPSAPTASVTDGLSAHVVVRDLESWPQILAEMTELLHSAFDIDHSTLQPELFRPALYAIREPESPRANP